MWNDVLGAEQVFKIKIRRFLHSILTPLEDSK